MRLAPRSCFMPFLLDGQADLLAGLVRRLEDGDLVAAPGRGEGGLQLRRASADDSRAARFGRGRDVVRHRLFAAGGGLVQAEGHAALVGSVEAVVRVDGRPGRQDPSRTDRHYRGESRHGGVAYDHRISLRAKGLKREIVPERAVLVRRIFDDYADGLSPRHVAAKLEEDGISSPSGGKWNDSTIRGNAKKRDGTLRNEAYAGILVYGRDHFLGERCYRAPARPSGNGRGRRGADCPSEGT